MAVLGLMFLAPAAAIFFFAFPSGTRASGLRVRVLLALFGVAALAAAVGVARIDHPVKMELLWPLTLEQSGYFEFSLQMLWSRFVWIFFSSSLLFGFAAYDGSVALEGRSQRMRPLFLTGSFFFAVLAFLSENTLLSLMFVEIAAFALHAFGMEAGGTEGELEKASYFKRSCFLFLGFLALLAIALTRELSTPSVMLMGAVLYILSTVISKHNPRNWGQLALTLVHIGMALFLLERVMNQEVSPELWVPLSAVFALGCIVFAGISLLSPAGLGASFWLVLSVLGYLLYLRFSSARPADPFWGAYEAIGLGAAYAMATMYRFGERMDVLWKRALAFVLLALFLGILSGALPSVEISAARFDSETSLAKITLLGLLTFLISAVSAKSLGLSLAGAGGGSPRASSYLACIAPAFVLLATQAGALLRWNDLNFDSVAAGGLGAMLYDPRVLVTATALGAGLLAGGLLGANSRFAGWTKSHELRMENFFPAIDPSLVRWNLYLVNLPERGGEWVSIRISGFGGRVAGLLDALDRGFFGDKLFRGFSEYSSSLSLLTRFFHSGQARMYLFLGVVITLLSSFVFLMEGR